LTQAWPKIDVDFALAGAGFLALQK